MSDLIGRLESDHVFVLCIVVSGVVFLICAALGPVLTRSWRRVRERDAAVTIVVSMLQDGKSVDDIERVLKAGGFDRQARNTVSGLFGRCHRRPRSHRSASPSSGTGS